MAKDLEKENQKLEKQNKKLKKKNSAGGKVILFLLLVIVILAALMFFFDPFGWGIGPGAGNGGSGGSSAPAAENTEAAEDAEEITDDEDDSNDPYYSVISVTVSGSTYLMDGAETTLDDIIGAIDARDSLTMVEITDDSATQNAMEALTGALEANGYPYSII